MRNNQVPRLVEVRDNDYNWVKRIFVGYSEDNRFKCVTIFDTIRYMDGSYAYEADIKTWDYMREIVEEEQQRENEWREPYWVSVRDDVTDSWERRIYLGMIESGEYRCVNKSDQEEYRRGKDYGTRDWVYMKKEEEEERKTIPYTQETFPLWAHWIRRKGGNHYFAITKIDTDVIYYWDGHLLTGQSYTFINDFEIAGADGIWKPFYQEI